MKKAKIMLAAVAVLGIVGGTLAFKANKFSTQGLYTGALGTTVCTYELGITITPNLPGATVVYTTEPNAQVGHTAHCSLTTLTTAGE